MNHESWAIMSIKYHLNVLKSTFPQTSSWKDQQPDPNRPPLPPLEPDLSWTHWEDTNPLVKFVIFVCTVYVWFMYDLILLDSDHIPNLDQQWNTTAPIISAWVKSAQLNPAALHSLGHQRTKKLRQIPASTIPAVPFTGKHLNATGWCPPGISWPIPHLNLHIII